MRNQPLNGKARGRPVAESGRMPRSFLQPTTRDDDARDPVQPRVDVGILTSGSMPMDLVDQSVELLAARLRERFPDFDWCFFEQRWAPQRGAPTTEPSTLLIRAAERRDAASWDFVLVITDADLAGHYQHYAFSMLSRPLDAAVVSLARLHALGPRADRRSARMATLLQQALAHLAGLDGHTAPDNLLYRPTHAENLDAMTNLTQEQAERWRCHLVEIADQRLEETPHTHPPLRFLMAAAWINRTEIAQAILGARPWQLPYRLGRLTAAAVSSLAIITLTAESWDLGLSLDGARISALGAAALVGTTLYVTAKQRLLLKRAVARTEQTVVTAVASVFIVFLGMLTTWVLLVFLGFGGASLLFPDQVIAGWAPAALAGPSDITGATLLRMATFAASLATMIGALGASFEDEHYFRHIVLIDEEI